MGMGVSAFSNHINIMKTYKLFYQDILLILIYGSETWYLTKYLVREK